MEKEYFVYIMASDKNGTLYIGVTNNIAERVNQHKEGKIEGFTKKYNIKYLVHYELYNNINDALEREKQLKKWKRERKINLIEKDNPGWRDLFEDLF